jgi:hypothetical protein
VNRASYAESLLRSKGRVTNGDVVRDDPFKAHCFRNGISECKHNLEAEGFTVRHFTGKTWLESGWELIPTVHLTVQECEDRYFL